MAILILLQSFTTLCQICFIRFTQKSKVSVKIKTTGNLTIIWTQLQHFSPLSDLCLFRMDTNVKFFKCRLVWEAACRFYLLPNPHLSVWTQADCVFVTGAIAAPLMLCKCSWDANDRLWLCYQMYFSRLQSFILHNSTASVSVVLVFNASLDYCWFESWF